MNLNNDPTIEQLTTLMADCNESRLGHIMYARADGEVKIKSLPYSHKYREWVDDNPDNILVRFEYLHPNSGIVGKYADKSKKWPERIFNRLKSCWDAKVELYPSYIDYY